MPYCLFDKNTKEYIGGQLHARPEPYDCEKHVCLVLDEYPSRDCKLNDDLVTFRQPTEKEAEEFRKTQADIYYEQLCKGQSFKFMLALAEIVVEVSNGKKLKNIDELIAELKKKFKWP